MVTTTGRNSRGLLAGIATAVAEMGGDVLDVSQTIIGEFFTMIMMVEIGELQVPFSEFKRRLETVSQVHRFCRISIHCR